jgi:hypothetical protein
MPELLPETKQIFAQFPLLKQVWEDNLEPPVFPSRKPHEVRFYMGDTFTPVFRLIDGVVVEHNPPEEGPYTLLVVADDVPASLSVGTQEIFNYTDMVELPEFSLQRQEMKLAILEAQLAEVAS